MAKSTHHHPVSSPATQATGSQLRSLLPGGLEGLPTTVFIDPSGKITNIHTGQYEPQGSPDSDIQADAGHG